MPLVEPEVGDAFDTVLQWADELRTLRVRANADTPEDARKAREFGAEGIGLCRTEHMFFGEDRHEKMVQVILADDVDERRKRLDELAPLQQGDFEGLFEAMEGLPVTIRLLDPPLHEFLPDPDELPEGPQRTVPGRCRRSTRCWARAACASGSSIRRSTRCRSAR